MDHFDEYGPTFCVLPWLHLMTRPEGTMQLCCMNSEEILRDEGSVFHLSESDPAEIWNGRYYRDIRKRMLAGEQIPSCRSCYQSEAVGKASYRERSNGWWADHRKTDARAEVVRIVAASKADGFKVECSPKSLDLRLGNRCNLGCRSCDPLTSSRVAQEWAAIRKDLPAFSEFWDGPEKNKQEIREWHEDEGFLNYIRGILPEVKMLYMTGGEPTLVRGNSELIKFCIAAGHAADIELMLNTNMTLNDPEFFESLRHFKKVQLNCSIDGLGPVNDYLRFPSKWEKVAANLCSFLELSGNIHITVDIVVQFHNVFDLTDLLRHVDQLRAGQRARDLNIDLIVLKKPSFLNMTVLPSQIRRTAASRLRNFSRSSSLYREDPYSRQCIDAVIEMLSTGSREAQGLLAKNLRFTEILDRNRGVSMADFLPELNAMMKAEGIG